MNLTRLTVWLKQHRKKLIIWGGGTFSACILFAVLLLPIIIKSQAEKGILKATGRIARIESVRFNPFGMTLTVRGFSLLEPDAKTPFVQLGRLRVSLSSTTFFRFAPVVDELRLDNLQLGLVRTAANRYNFSDILDRLAAEPKKEQSAPPRFSINNISLHDSSIDFEDQAVPGGKKHTIRDLQLAIPFISNMPYLADQYTDPKFSAVVNGARFSFNGKTKPFATSMQTNLELKLSDLNLPYYLAYLPAQVPVKLDSGKLTLDLNLTYRIHKDKKPELVIKGLTRLDQISVKEKNGTALASFKRFDVMAREIELFGRKVGLQQVALDDLQLHVDRDGSGRLNFQRLLPPAKTAVPKQAEKPAKKEAAPALQLVIDNLALTNGSLLFSDKQPAGGFKAQLQAINLKLTNLSTAANAQSNYELSLNGDQQESLSIAGTTVLSPLAATARFNLANLKLQRGWPYLQAILTAPVKGTLGLEGKAAWSTKDGADLQDLAIHVKEIAATYGDKDGAKLSSLDLSGISFNQKENKAAINEIKLGKGNLQISREVDGTISALSLLKPAAPTTASQGKPPVTTAKTTVKSNKKPLTWQVKKISIAGLGTTFLDKSFSEPPVFKLSNIRLNTGNLTGPTFSAMPLSFSASYGSGAPVKVAGTVTPLPFRYKGTASFAKIPLRDFESYIPDNVNLFVLGGTLDSTMKLDLALGSDGKPKGSFSGNAGVRGLHTVDSLQEDDLLKWESLQLDQIQGNLAPFSLAIHQIALNGVYARIAIRKDGTLNLQNLITKQTLTPSPSPTGRGEQNQNPLPPGEGGQRPGEGAVSSSTPKGPIKIDALTIQDGTMDFSDSHLPQQFRTTFYNLGGRVSGLSSDMNTRAEVDLRGNLENHSPLQITGAVNPLRDDLFVDLTISFKDIELAPATPYSGTYLGYQIDKGKLFLDLKYHIENKKLEASNKVFVDQFTFGNAVKSDKATKLPVRLGLALLKDRNGQINLDLPVAGRTDDPKFSIWGVVWQVVVNLFVKAATSPFALLSSMFGSGEDLSSVNFAPGSIVLAPSEEKKLATLATALNQRPGLKVEISGYVDKAHDPEGYRSELLLQKMRQEKYLELAKNSQIKEGEDAEQMVIQPAEYSHYLKAVYLKEKFPKPRNLIGMVKDLPDAEMKKLIIANTKVGDQELQQLAVRRAVAVRQYLMNKGKIESQRLFQKQDNILKPPKQDTSTGSRVELNPIAS